MRATRGAASRVVLAGRGGAGRGAQAWRGVRPGATRGPEAAEVLRRTERERYHPNRLARVQARPGADTREIGPRGSPDRFAAPAAGRAARKASPAAGSTRRG